jgi:hypothetical protein
MNEIAAAARLIDNQVLIAADDLINPFHVILCVPIYGLHAEPQCICSTFIRHRVQGIENREFKWHKYAT